MKSLLKSAIATAGDFRRAKTLIKTILNDYFVAKALEQKLFTSKSEFNCFVSAVEHGNRDMDSDTWQEIAADERLAIVEELWSLEHQITGAQTSETIEDSVERFDRFLKTHLKESAAEDQLVGMLEFRLRKAVTEYTRASRPKLSENAQVKPFKPRNV